MRKGIFFTAVAALALFAGCQSSQNYNVPVGPKWKGAPYRLAFGAQPAKPSPAGLTIPPIKYTANPDALERRATLVIQFDTSGAKKQPAVDKLIMAPVDISGAEGTLPADYVDAASKGLAKTLASYGIKGKIKLSIALTDSSLSMTATDDEVNDKRLSDWLPLEVDFRSSHPKG